MAIHPKSKFETTHWSVVLSAGNGSGEALAELCAAYWQPVHTFFRRKRGAEEARDLTQGFFARLLERGEVADADPTRGRFRNWLLKAASSYRANEADRALAKKRGGGILPLSIDALNAEERHDWEPADHRTPEQSYERRWALIVLDRVFCRLGDEYTQRGEAALFKKLVVLLVGDNHEKQDEMARELGMEAGNFRMHVHRIKKRFKKLLKAEIARTVSTDDDVEEELRFLREAVRSR